MRRFATTCIAALALTACGTEEGSAPGAVGGAPSGGSAGTGAAAGTGAGGAGVGGGDAGTDSGGSPGGGGTSLGGTGGAAGAAGTTWVPDPIPSIDPEPDAPCTAAQSGDYYQFLDDVCNVKAHPATVDPDFACPVVDSSATVQLLSGSTVTYDPPGAASTVDQGALAGIVPSTLDVAVILVKRVGGVPHFRYLSNGSHAKVVQPWSTTKFLAAANAASTLRIQSGYAVGLTASVGSTPLGDLVTSLHNYDNAPYSSNGLGRYFHDIGGRKRANDLIHSLWLGRPAGETFGGNYGAAAPTLGYTFTEPGGASISVTPDSATGYSNALSMLTLAEALKRLVLHREVEASRLPGIQWKDLSVLFYGAPGSNQYGAWGGMSADTAIYLQSSHDFPYLQKRSQGRWRILSKLGLGSSGQFLNVGYACFPVLDPSGSPVVDLGRELVIATHLPTGGATWRERDRLLAKSYREIMARVVDGRL